MESLICRTRGCAFASSLLTDNGHISHLPPLLSCLQLTERLEKNKKTSWLRLSNQPPKSAGSSDHHAHEARVHACMLSPWCTPSAARTHIHVSSLSTVGCILTLGNANSVSSRHIWHSLPSKVMQPTGTLTASAD